MWKFSNFSITEFLHEFNFGDSRGAESAILSHLETLKFDFYEILHFFNPVISLTNKFRSPKMAKNGNFSTSTFSKIDFT